MRVGFEFQKHFVRLLVFLMSLTEGSTMRKGAACGHQFSIQIRECMGAFQQLYSDHEDERTQAGRHDDLLTKHLCLEYEKTLQCLHVALSSCATVKNTQRVQRKLSSGWVIHINQLCHIQSGSSDIGTDQSENRDNLDNRTDKSDSHEGKTEVGKSDARKFDNEHRLYKGEKFVDKNAETWSRVIKVRKYKHSMVVSDTQQETTKYKIYTFMKDLSSSGSQISLCMLHLMLASILQIFVSDTYDLN